MPFFFSFASEQVFGRGGVHQNVIECPGVWWKLAQEMFALFSSASVQPFYSCAVKPCMVLKMMKTVYCASECTIRVLLSYAGKIEAFVAL